MKDRLLKPTGDEMDYTYIEGKGAAATLAITSDERVILTHQYRHALRKTLFDLPAGGIRDDEQPEEAALRELREETGFRASAVHSLGQFYPAPGLMNQSVYVFYATSVEVGTPTLDEHESIDVVLMDWKPLLQMVRSGEGIDVTLAYAVMLYLMRDLP